MEISPFFPDNIHFEISLADAMPAEDARIADAISSAPENNLVVFMPFPVLIVTLVRLRISISYDPSVWRLTAAPEKVCLARD